jgi:NAD-dependent deacetylase sirtuin 4
MRPATWNPDPVPSAPPGSLAELVELVRGGGVVVLAGAGMSTDSGIPDYRSPGSKPRRPIQGPEFVRDPSMRARYWARSMLGYPTMSRCAPNAAHRALAALERSGHVAGVITQNVDRLHQAAGTERVLELHGALAEVRCLACGAREGRAELQQRLVAMNPGFAVAPAQALPDGDAELEPVEGFVVPACRACGGVLKPDVVFFGENVARPLVDEAFSWVTGARALLVLGSSLAVFSGYRFVRHAAGLGLPVAIVNRGVTRGDPHARFRLDASLGEALPALAAAVAAS